MLDNTRQVDAKSITSLYSKLAPLGENINDMSKGYISRSHICESNISVSRVESVDKSWSKFNIAVLKEDFNSKLCTITPGEGNILYTLSIKEKENDNSVVININTNCFREVCTCTHYIGGVIAQLKPCRFRCELFM